MNKYNLTTDKIYNEYMKKELSIIHIADIHFSYNTKEIELDSLVNYIALNKPNYIMITGDLIDIPDITIDTEKMKEFTRFLENLGKIAKVLISLGNHDIMNEFDCKYFDNLNKIHNVHVLNNKKYIDDNVSVIGLTLPNYYYYNVTKHESVSILNEFLNEHNNLINVNNKIPRILLVHSPICISNEIILDRLDNFDLILCGHTHGGMVPKWLNFLFRKNYGIIAPDKRLFPEIAKGKIIDKRNGKEITIIINGGITKLSRQAGKNISKLNFLYAPCVNKIIISKKEGKKDE